MIVTLTMTSVHSTATQFTGLDWTALHFQIDKYYINLTNILQLLEASQKIISRLETKWIGHIRNFFYKNLGHFLSRRFRTVSMQWIIYCDCGCGCGFGVTDGFIGISAIFPTGREIYWSRMQNFFASPWSCKNFEIKCWILISPFSRSRRISPT